MRVLVAGASGAIGQPLIRQLRDAGHEVLGTTRSPERAGQFEAAGATPVIVDPLHAEEDPLIDPGPEAPAFQRALALTTLERATLETPGLDGVVLRYGFFYGPGTHFARGSRYWSDVMKRRFPIVGNGAGVFSYIH